MKANLMNPKDGQTLEGCWRDEVEQTEEQEFGTETTIESCWR